MLNKGATSATISAKGILPLSTGGLLQINGTKLSRLHLAKVSGEPRFLRFGHFAIAGKLQRVTFHDWFAITPVHAKVIAAGANVDVILTLKSRVAGWTHAVFKVVAVRLVDQVSIVDAKVLEC